MWPLGRLLPHKTNLNYTRFGAVAGVVSVALVLLTFASILTGAFTVNPISVYEQTQGSSYQKVSAIFARSFNFGIDFKGGNLLEFDAPQAIDLQAVRTATQLQEGLQGFADQKHAIATFQTPAGQTANAAVEQMKAKIASVVPGVTFPRVEVVGPKVSSELFTKGVLALLLAVLLMLVYIWFRFEWQFGLGAVLALFHDLFLTLGLFSFFRIEFTLTIIAALLTIIGYSMNDTVVVFDRMRENLRKFKKMSLRDLINLSLNETLARTLMTSMTTLLAVLAILFVGGETLKGFAIAMTFGIFIGTYSSIYVAAPAILIWGVNRGAIAKTAKEEDPAAALP